MAIDFAAVNLPVIIGAALVDSINPCAFGVLLFLLAFLLKSVKKRSVMITNGLIYIVGVFIVLGLWLKTSLKTLWFFVVIFFWWLLKIFMFPI